HASAFRAWLLVTQRLCKETENRRPCVHHKPGFLISGFRGQLHVHAWKTARVLFGGRHLGTQHDFPSALDALVTRTQGLWGRAEDIATERTLLRFFRPFLAAEDLAAALLTMRSPSVAHLKFSLGLLTSRFGASHPLKACPVCIREDLDRYGWSYWHGAHQFPGIWICAEHGEALLQSSVKTTGIGRFEWHLPSPDALCPWCDGSSSAEMAGLGTLTALIGAVVNAPRRSGWIADSPIGSAVGRRLAARGWVTAGGSLRIRAAAENYLDYCIPLRSAPDLPELPAAREDAERQVGRLLRSIHDGTHPLRILVAIGWLFGDLENFVAALATEGEPVDTPATDPDPEGNAHASGDGRRERLIQLLVAGHSARSSAKMIGVDVNTAIHWAVAAGIAIQRRPKVLIPSLIWELSADLRQGLTKGEVAEKRDVPMHIVTRLLHTQVGLHAAWKRALAARKQTDMRRRWEAVNRANPGIGVKLSRAMEPAAYAWLYRHDRTWLREHSPMIAPEGPRSRRHGVDWDARDEHLKDAVERAALEFVMAAGAKKLRLGALCQAVPSLKAKLSALHKLPRTRRALEQALQRRCPLDVGPRLLP
ncbi:TnsD family Tn7-like transposition protein, partial [Metallibacterium sp.]